MILGDTLTKFIVNKYLSLKLEKGKTVIYVENIPFKQCKYLLLNIPVDEITHIDNLKSIDEVSEKLDHDLEPTNVASNYNKIPPKVEFWGHCSNLQVWYENNYDTKLLHSNLAFPLLKKLTEVGDLLARKVFKEEIAKRYNTGVKSVRAYLKNGKYLKFLTNEEFFSLLDEEYDIIKKLEAFTDREWLKIDIENGKVIGLTHHGKKLEQIPEPIRSLTSLKKLDLRHNLITEIPEWIGELKSLKKLYLSNNKLIGFPKLIGNLKSLEILEAYNNELQTLPESIGALTSLRKISLFNNKLKEIPASIGNLTRLEELDLHENMLATVPESIGSLKSLKKFRLGENNLKLIPATLGKLTNLKTLLLNKNDLSDLPDELGELNRLEILDISENVFESLRKPFDSLISLKELWLDDNPLKEIPDFVYKLPLLRLIGIRNTNINKSGIMKNNFKKKEVNIYK
jgi:Leucine-rich repeat (LRR) protein